MAEQYTEEKWKQLAKDYKDGLINTNELIAKTEGQYEHPDWWNDLPCLCDYCLSCAM